MSNVGLEARHGSSALIEEDIANSTSIPDEKNYCRCCCRCLFDCSAFAIERCMYVHNSLTRSQPSISGLYLPMGGQF